MYLTHPHEDALSSPLSESADGIYLLGRCQSSVLWWEIALQFLAIPWKHLKMSHWNPQFNLPNTSQVTQTVVPINVQQN